MNILPVIERELRVQSRNPANYRLRVVVVIASAIVASVVMTNSALSTPQIGATLFGDLNTILLVMMAFFLPGMTADCLSREKREGTLSLLFLTPLGVGELVFAKVLVQLLRALSMLITLLPVFSVPVLLGGVGWKEVIIALLTDSAVACLFLSAGLLASALCTRWNRAVLTAQLLSIVFVSVYALLYTLFLFKKLSQIMPMMASPNQLSIGEWIFSTLIILTDYDGVWSGVWFRSPTAVWTVWLESLAYASFLAAWMVLLAFLCAIRRLKQFRHETDAYSETRWARWFLRPVIWKDHIRKSLNRALDKNPIAWLQQYSCGGRASKWGWCAVILIIEIGATSLLSIGLFRDLFQSEIIIAMGLGLIIAVVANASFQREKENGVLELLLVSPVTVDQIITGRVFGLWSQFIPSIAMVMLCCSMLWPFFPTDRFDGSFTGFAILCLSGAASISIIGLYFSLRARKLSVALGLTFAVVAVLAPAISVTLSLVLSNWYDQLEVAGTFTGFAVGIAVSQGLLALLCCFLLRHSLSRRIYPF